MSETNDKKKFLGLSGIRLILDNLKEKYSPLEHTHDDLYYTENEVDGLLLDLKSGNTVVAKAEEATHATNADKATSAEHANEADHAETADEAIKAEQDGNGNVIVEVYETKTEATAKLQEAKEYTNTSIANLVNSAPDTLDTLGELAIAFNENKEVVDVINEAITNKVDKSVFDEHTHSWNDLEDKPFGEEDTRTYVLTSTTFEVTGTSGSQAIDSSGYNADLVSSLTSSNNYPLIAIFDGVQYDSVVKQGAIFILKEDGSDWFSLRYMGNALRIVQTVLNNTGEHTLEIFDVAKETKTLDEKYIPDTIARTSNVMAKSNPTGTGSLSMNRKANTTVGSYSVAEGFQATASGSYSHAEGYMTTASGSYSHAEGQKTTANKSYSHAEGTVTTASGVSSHAEGGSTTASGDYSHAEGYYTEASDIYSHAEGYYSKATATASHAEGTSTASGIISHAEGNNTTASGQYSHAEGDGTTASGVVAHAEGWATIASGGRQHVQGQYNIEDTEGKYAHIVGNGDAEDNRSNAHTLDWDGNAWYAGTIKVGGTSYDDASEVALKSDLENINVDLSDYETKEDAQEKYDELATQLNNKADKEHSHKISDVVNLQTKLDEITSGIGQKANISDLTSHTDDTTVHITEVDRTKLIEAYEHSKLAHASNDAEKNIIIGVIVNGEELSIDENRKINISTHTLLTQGTSVILGDDFLLEEPTASVTCDNEGNVLMRCSSVPEISVIDDGNGNVRLTI